VPRNTNDDDEGCAGGVSWAAWPLGTAAAIEFAGASDRDEGVVLCLCGRRRLPTKAKALLFLPFQLVFYVE
jgi:hypothetical protein